MIGRVVSTKMTSTVTVLVERVAKHPLYKKTYSQTKKYLVDALIAVKEGDIVEIVKVKPISKNKHWRILKIIGKNLEAITADILQAQAEEVISEVMPEEKKVDRVQDVGPSEEEKVEKKEKTKSKSKKEKNGTAQK